MILSGLLRPGRSFRTVTFGLMLTAHFFLLAWLGQQGVLGAAGLKLIPLYLLGVVFTLGLIHTYPLHKTTAWIPLLVGILARVLIFPLEPSDDVNRYVWEGKVLNADLNPYRLAPDDPTLADLRDGILWPAINHPDKSAIYGPVALWTFAGWERIRSTPRFFTLALTLVDLLALAVLLRLLAAYRRHPKWALLYALHPLPLLAFAGEGHLDALVVLGLMLLLWFHQQKRWPLMYACVAGITLIKWPLLIAWPLILHPRHLRWAWITPVLILLPFPFFTPWTDMFNSLTVFGRDMMYNGSLQQIFRTVLKPGAASLFSLFLLGLGVGIIRLILPRPHQALLAGLSLALFLSGTVHFWYISLLIPLLCLTPSVGLIVWSATIAFSFTAQIHFHQTGTWAEGFTGTWVEYGLVLGAFLITWRRNQPHTATDDLVPRPRLQTVSVIIPTLNETDHLPTLLKSLEAAHDFPVEMVVVDGGSTDDTVQLSRNHGANVLQTPLGRGNQIARGIQEATGDLLVIAHADMIFPPGSLTGVRNLLNRTGRRGGCMGSRFSGTSRGLTLISWLNRQRARWGGLSFGDQVQFIRRDALPAIGGFPNLSLMEDVEFSLRLRELEAPLYAGIPVTVSSRSWDSHPVGRRSRIILLLVAVYLWRRCLQGPQATHLDLYHRYYPS